MSSGKQPTSVVENDHITQVQQEAVLAMQIKKTQDLYEAEIERLDVTRQRVRQTFLFFTLIATLSGCLVGWVLIQQYRFKKQFGKLIDVIDHARSTGLYTGPSGMQTIWAYEYGTIGSFLSGFTSSDLAVAIVDSFYDKAMNAAFLGTDNGVSALVGMRSLAMRGNYNANQIMCATLFPNSDDPSEPNKCRPNCNASTATSDAGKTAAYLGAAVQGLGLGIGGGAMAYGGINAAMDIAKTAFGPVGFAVGAAVTLASVAGSLWSTHSDIQRKSSACKASLQGCINVDQISC